MTKQEFLDQLQYGTDQPEAKVIFHGGCLGCLTQHKRGVDECRNCQYFDADWSLPDLSERKPDPVDIERDRIKKKYKKSRFWPASH